MGTFHLVPIPVSVKLGQPQTQILEIFLYILRLTPFCVYRIRFR